jgi:hypothetical protein
MSKLKLPILVLVSILFTLFIIELSVRVSPNFYPKVIKYYFRDEEYQHLGLRPDQDLGYVYTDRAGETMSLGYPDIGFRDDGIASETDIVVIGDSFTACVGVEIQECWVEIIEKKTSRDFANLGVLDYGPQQELQMLERYGLPLKPKVILWVFFANDVNDAWRFKEFGKGAIRGEFLKNPIQSWLIENSAVYTVLTFSWYNRYLFYNLSQTDGETAPQDTDLGPIRITQQRGKQ